MAQAGRLRTASTPVLLNVYDLSSANDFMFSFGLGAHHSGVEVNGTEYTFASGGGVFEHGPRDAPGAKWRETIHMGNYGGTSAELRAVVNDLRLEWGGDTYNILTRNCNSFANELCLRLLKKPCPPYVNRLAWLGSFVSCCLPPETLGGAPVDDTSGGGSSSAGGRVVVHAPRHVAFEGSGMTLGSRAVAGGVVAPAEALVAGGGAAGAGAGEERRERMRQAAMARMQRQQQEQETLLGQGDRNKARQ